MVVVYISNVIPGSELISATAGRALNVLGILDVDADEYYSELDEYNSFLQSNNEIFSRQNFCNVEDEIDPVDQYPVPPFEQNCTSCNALE